MQAMKNSKEDVAQFFEDDSSDYLKHQYAEVPDSFMALRRERAARLIEAHVVPSMNEHFRFLDAGCGPGILLEVLGRYPIQYSGVDISTQMLELARRQSRGCAAGFRGEFLQGDVEHLPFPSNSFGAAASLGVIEYLNGDDELLAELQRVTVPGGFILLAVTNGRSYNLMLEGLLSALRKGRLTSRALSAAKSLLGRGQFKQRSFTIRRHRPAAFLRQVQQRGLQVVASEYWGFNLLPHPLHVLCGRRLNRLANRVYDRVKIAPVQGLGEGFIVLCRKPAAAAA